MINRIISLILIFAHLSTYTYASWFDALKQRNFSVYLDPTYDYSRGRIDIQKNEDQMQIVIHSLDAEKKESTILLAQRFSHCIHQDFNVDFGQDISITFRQTEDGLLVKKLFSTIALDFVTDQNLNVLDISCFEKIRFSSEKDIFLNGNLQFHNDVSLKAENIFLQGHCLLTSAHFMANSVLATGLHFTVLDQLKYESLGQTTGQFTVNQSTFFAKKIDFSKNTDVICSQSTFDLQDEQKFSARHFKLIKSTFNFLEELLYDVDETLLTESQIVSSSAFILMSDAILFQGDNEECSKIQVQTIKKTPFVDCEEEGKLSLVQRIITDYARGVVFSKLSLESDIKIQNQELLLIEDCFFNHQNIELGHITNLHIENSSMIMNLFQSMDIQKTNIENSTLLSKNGLFLSGDQFRIDQDSSLFHFGSLYLLTKTFDLYGSMRIMDCDVCLGQADSRMAFNVTGGKIHISQQNEGNNKTRFFLSQGIIKEDSSLNFFNQDATFDVVGDILFLKSRSSIQSNALCQFFYDFGIELHDGSFITAKSNKFIHQDFTPQGMNEASSNKLERSEFVFFDPTQKTEDEGQNTPKSTVSSAQQKGRIHIEKNSYITSLFDLYVSTNGLIGVVDHSSMNSKQGLMTLLAKKGFQVCQSAITGNIFNGEFLEGTTRFYHESHVNFSCFSANLRDFECFRSAFDIANTCILKAQNIPMLSYQSCLQAKIFDFTVSSSLTDDNPQAHLHHFLFKKMVVDLFRLTYDGFLVNQEETHLPSLCFMNAKGLINFSKIESDHDLVLILKNFLLNNRLGAAQETAVDGLSLGAFPLKEDIVLKNKCQHAAEDLKAYFIKEDAKKRFKAFQDILTHEGALFSKINTNGNLRISAPLIASITGSIESHKKLILQSPDIQFGIGIESKEEITLRVGDLSDHKKKSQIVSRYACGPVYLKGFEGIFVENKGGRFINSLGKLLAPKRLSIHDSKLSLNYGGKMDISGDFYLDADIFINQTGVKQHAGILNYNHYDIPTTSVPLLTVHGKWVANVRLFHNIGGMIHSEEQIQFNRDRLEQFNNEHLILTYHRHYYKILLSVRYEHHFLKNETFYTYKPRRVDEKGSWCFVPSTISTPNAFDVQAPHVCQKGNIISSGIFLKSTASPLELGYQQNKRLTHQSVFSGFIPASTDGKTYETISAANLNFPVVIIADKKFEEIKGDYHFMSPCVDLFQKGLVQHLNTSCIPELFDTKNLLEKTYAFFKNNQHLLSQGSVVPESVDGIYLPIMVTDASILEKFPDCALVYQIYHHDGGVVFAPTLYIGKKYDLAKLTARADGGIFQRQPNDDSRFNVLLMSSHGVLHKGNTDVQSDIGYYAPYVNAERRTHESVAVWDEPIDYEEYSGGLFKDYTRTQKQGLRSYTEREKKVIFKTDGKILYFSKELTFKGVDVFAKKGQFACVLNASIDDIHYQIPIQDRKSALFSYDNYVVPYARATKLKGGGDIKILSLNEISINGVKVDSGNEIKFISLNALMAQASFAARKGIHLESLRKDVLFGSKVLRQTRHNPENFKDKVFMQGTASGENVNFVAKKGNVCFSSIHVDSENTTVRAGKRIIDDPLSLTNQSKIQSQRTTTSKDQASSINAKETVSMVAGAGIHLKGTQVEAKLIKMMAIAGCITFGDARQTHDVELDMPKHKARDMVSLSYPASLRAQSLFIQTLGAEDITFVGTKIECPLTQIKLNGGKVHFKAGKNHFYSFRFDDDSNLVVSDVTTLEKKDKTFVLPKIIGEIDIEGALKIIATKIDEASKKYKTQGYYTSVMYAMMDEAGVSCNDSNENEYLKSIKNLDPKILEYVLAKEVHEYSCENITRPGPVLVAVVAVATSVFTMGYGAALAGQMVGAANASVFASGTIGAAMTNAAFSCVCSQLAVNTMNNNGDPFKSVGELFHKDSLKNLCISVVSAGVAHGVLDTMGYGGLGAGAENAFEEAAKAKSLAAAIEAGTYAPTAINETVDALSVKNVLTNIKTHVTQSLCGSVVKTTFGEKEAFSHVIKDTTLSIINTIGAQAIGQADIDKITKRFMHAANSAVLGGATNGIEGAIACAVGTTVGMQVAQTLHETGTSTQTAANLGQMAGAVVGGLTADPQNVNIASQAAGAAIRNDFIPKATESDIKKMLEVAAKNQEKEREKEQERQNAEKEEQAQSREPKRPLSQEQKDAYKALAHDVMHPFGDVQENELQGLFYDHHDPQNASEEDCYLSERIKKTEALQAQAEGQGRFDEAEIYAEIASRLHKQRPPSPTIHDTAGRQAAYRFSDRFIPNFVKKGVHFVGQEMHDFGQDIDDRFNAFLKNPSLKTFQDAELTLKASKEVLGFAGDVICTTVDHAKSVARRGLRFAGVDANIAQDLVDAAEIATCIAPVLQSAYVAVASTKIGVKTASALRDAVHEISSATRFGLDVLEDYARFKARGPQLVYARSRAFDRTFSAPKRAHSSIIFQQRTSYAPAAKASAAPAAAPAETRGLQSVAKKPVTAYDFKDYIREIESVSGLQIPSEQKAYLVQMLRENNYTKIQGSDLVAHRELYSSQKAKLINDWETMGGHVKVREWPKYAEVTYRKDGTVYKDIGYLYDAHHIIPQSYLGPQTWKNLHPVKFPDHQTLVHGANSVLADIIKKVGQ
ncbi:MAG: hypothetical protein CNLJKLNK_00527 [Holosporales bacterium]